jgi:mevalonate kinase
VDRLCDRYFLPIVNASAPGKMILFGEHAVVYGRPALAVPVKQVHADVEILDSNSTGIWIHAPGIRLHSELNALPSDHPIASVIHNFLFLARASLGEGRFPNINLTINSTIPVASGLGSGAAVTVALVRALSSHLNYPMSEEDINAFAYDIEKIYHGAPSGIDNTVVTYAKPVYFVKGQPIETFKVGTPFTIVIGGTGISAPTRESVADVRKLWEADRAKWEGVFDAVGKIADEARMRIETGEPALSKVEGWRLLGGLMNQNHERLQEMTVSSPELDLLVEAARKAGAAGAKLSGGGRGGNMIALVERENADDVSSALISAGAKNTIITQVA